MAVLICYPTESTMFANRPIQNDSFGSQEFAGLVNSTCSAEWINVTKQGICYRYNVTMCLWANLGHSQYILGVSLCMHHSSCTEKIGGAKMTPLALSCGEWRYLPDRVTVDLQGQNGSTLKKSGTVFFFKNVPMRSHFGSTFLFNVYKSYFESKECVARMTCLYKNNGAVS